MTHLRSSAGIIVFLLISINTIAQTSDSIIMRQMSEVGVRFTHDNDVKLLMSGKEKFADLFEAAR